LIFRLKKCILDSKADLEKRIMEVDKILIGDEEEEFPAIARLIELGRQKTYVTLDDILHFFPEAEQEAEQLEEAFSALLSAGIPFVEDTTPGEPTEDELAAVEETEPEVDASLDDYLANIDTDDTIGLYLKEVSRVPLLTAQEEVQLAQRIERGRSAREELAKGNTPARRRTDLRKLIEDGWAAREHLITANSRLVISVAKKYMGRGVPFLDLIQEGNIGLIRATKKFDYRRGHKFSTYATWWIRQAVTRAIADQGRTIRVPVHMGDQINKLLRVQHQLTQRLGREPSVEELAKALDVPPKKVENMIQVARRPLSLETPTDDEEDSVLGDFIEDDEAPPPDETATYNLLREHLGEVLNSLPPREVRILQLRYGLLDGQAYTLEEVGRKMGVTRERVRQIEAQALSRLRHPSIRRKLRDYLGE
jgi:RNA polymerase primary sigma factor